MSSSNDRRSRILSGDAVEAQRWDLPNMDERQRQSAEHVEVKPPTAAEIEAIQKSAEREGYELGYEKGQSDGYQQGLKDGQQVVAQAAESLREIVRHMAKPLAQLNQEVEQDLLSLAQAVAEQVLHRELDARPAALRKIIREGLQAIPTTEREGRILVNPEDHDWLLDDHALSIEGWQMVPDRDISRGGCVIESRNSSLDARLETRIAEVMERLFDQDEQGHGLHNEPQSTPDSGKPGNEAEPAPAAVEPDSDAQSQAEGAGSDAASGDTSEGEHGNR